jgi:hypothetical protein
MPLLWTHGKLLFEHKLFFLIYFPLQWVSWIRIQSKYSTRMAEKEILAFPVVSRPSSRQFTNLTKIKNYHTTYIQGTPVSLTLETWKNWPPHTIVYYRYTGTKEMFRILDILVRMRIRIRIRNTAQSKSYQTQPSYKCVVLSLIKLHNLHLLDSGSL